MKAVLLVLMFIGLWTDLPTWSIEPEMTSVSKQVLWDRPLYFSHGQPMIGKLVAMNTSPFSSMQTRPKLPVEPEEFDARELDAYYDWRNDMFFREFDLTGSGSVNFMTARRTYKVWLDEFGTPVVLTVGDPVFYWIDLNGNGKFEEDLGEMWKDPYEDGVTGNEEPYNNHDIQEPLGPGPEWSPGPHGGFKQPPCDPQFGC